MEWNIRKAAKYDLAALGEIMLRLDPGEGRIRCARSFQVWEGGGEYNVARSLRKCFGLKTTAVTALADNEIGRLIEDFMWQGGVDTEYVNFVPYDGVGRTVRNGLNFTERGFGVRGALGVPDRGNTAAAQMKPGDVNWEQLFERDGVRWLHTGGIFAALSESAMSVALEAVRRAKASGTLVSYDLNYRPSLWKSIGGIQRAQEVNRAIVPYVDVLIGNEEDFTACLGVNVRGNDAGLKALNVQGYREMLAAVAAAYPNLRAVASTLRTVHTATINDWQALLWMDGTVYESAHYENLEILDRVGGGDGFASGLIYGLLQGDPQGAVNYGAAHGALAMTTPGDTSMATLREVEKLVAGKGARVER